MKKRQSIFGKIRASRLLAMILALALCISANVAGAAFTQIFPTRAREAKKPTIYLEANAVVGEYCQLTGELEFAVYVDTPGEETFANLSFVMSYGPELTPCDNEGKPLGMQEGDYITMPSTALAGFNSTVYITKNKGDSCGRVFMTVSTGDMPARLASSVPLVTVKFRYDVDRIKPWAEDEKHGPHWIDNKTPGGPSLLWLAKTNEADAAPWGCRLLYTSGNNIYYSADADADELRNFTSIAPGGDFESNKLSYSEDNSVSQDLNDYNIRTRLVNAPTVARTITNEDDISILFYDHDDRLIGTLIVPSDQDARADVNAYVERNFVHPDLRGMKNVSSLKREDTYRGAEDGRNTTNGEDYPLTDVYDYVFMKRPMHIVGENIWEQNVDANGNAKWDAEYPWVYGWSVVLDPPYTEFTPSVMGIGELANYSGAYADTGAYRPMNGAAARLNVSKVGYSHYNEFGGGKRPSLNMVSTNAPMETKFMFADFNFAKKLPPVDMPFAGTSRVLMVKACFEPGEKLISGKCELNDRPYYTKASAAAVSNGGALEIVVSMTRIIRGEDGQMHGVPLIREPEFVAAFTRTDIVLSTYRADENDTYHPVRYSEEKGYEYQMDDGTWVHMPNYDEMSVPDDYVDESPLYVRLDPYTASNAEVFQTKRPSVFGVNDDTEGLRFSVYCAYHGRTEGGGEKDVLHTGRFVATETGYTMDILCPASQSSDEADTHSDEDDEAAMEVPDGDDVEDVATLSSTSTNPGWYFDFMDYCLVETYGGGVGLPDYGLPRSVMNDDYRETCKWWEGSYDHDNDCWYMHPYSPYIVPTYVDPIDKEAGEHLRFNWGPDQIIPTWWLRLNNKPNFPVPEQNRDSEYDAYIQEVAEKKAAEEAKAASPVLNVAKFMQGIGNAITSLERSAAAFSMGPYTDVTWDSWYCEAIAALSDGGLINGTGDGAFQPMGAITYSQFSNILAKAKGLNAGAENGYWAYDAIQTCLDQGYIQNLGEITAVNYDVPITREAATAGLMKAIPDALKQLVIETPVIPDEASIAAEYRDYVVDAYRYGVAKGGDGGLFRPQSTLSRAEFCQLLFNAGWTAPA